MADHIDFASLTLMDALDLGVLIEEDARERYAEFVEQLDVHSTPEAAIFFATMVQNETKHRDWLAERRRTLFGNAPARMSPTMLYEIEAPAFADAEAFMSARQALDVAMRAEVRAYRFFDEALPHVSDPDVRELFTELRDEEAEHQEMVAEQIAKLPPAPDRDPTDHVDEPVGL
jgi:rubrerythrin